jgi:autotransporter-associated beta strand protein
MLTLMPSSVISGNVLGAGNDTLQLGGMSAATFDVSRLGAAAQYRGFGKFNILDGANWTLSGLSTYTGATNVNAGTLSVNGSIASSSLTTVNAGGTLGGNGTVGNTTINGGTLAPGNSIGTLGVQGNLVFTAAASYMVEVSPANADRTNVTGTATLGGAAVKASFAAGTYVARQYTILNAVGGVSGTFNTLANTDLPANFKSSLSYDSNNAYLNLALDFVPPPGSGLNANQQSAANAIVGFFNTTGGIPLVFGGLTPAGLTQISGEVATGTQQTTFNAMGLFMGLLTDPFIAARGDPVASSSAAPQFVDEGDAASAYASNGKPRSKNERDAHAAVYRKAPLGADPYLQRWSVWAAGYGGSQTTDGNAVLGSNNTRSSIGGVAVGADYRFSPYTIAGFALAGGATSFSVNGLGSGRSDLFQAGAFVRHNVGAAYLTGALAYGWQDITTDRAVTVAGTDLLRARFNANAFSGRVEGGYRFLTPSLGGMGITPYAAGQFVTFDLPAYAEQAVAGANTFALSYASKSLTDTRSELGLRTDKSFAMPNGIFTLRGRAAWAHDFNTDRSITPTFQTLPGASFVVNGAAPAHDAALVTAAAEMKWLNGFSLAGTFEAEFSNVTRAYAGKGVVRYAW